MTQIARCSILAALFSFIVNQTEGQNLTPSIEAALFGVNDTVIYTDTLFDPSLFPLSGGGGGGCNQVCNNPGFENGPNGQILGDAVNGFTYAGVAGSPTSQNSNSLIIPCVESANQTPVGSLLYWWNVNQDENNVVCTNESDVNCVVYSTSNWGSSVDLISSLPGNNPNQELFFESPNGVNPTAWNPCNNQNDHYLRFCTFDGLRQLLPTANCPVRFQDMNEYAEAVCYGAFNNGDALLQQGDEYVIEFMTACNPLLFQSDLSPLGTAAVDAGLSYFISSNTPADHRGFSTAGACTRPNGTFVPNNVAEAWIHEYQGAMEWQRVSTSFVASSSGVHRLFFSPNTPHYHDISQFEWMSYFIDDVFVTPITENPISAELISSVQNNATIDVALFIQTDWNGANTQPITIDLILPPGIEVLSGLPITIDAGALGPEGTTFSATLSFGPQSIPDFNYSIAVVADGACLNHPPCFFASYQCTEPVLNFINPFPSCTQLSLGAEIVSDGEYTFSWSGPNNFVASGATIQPPTPGEYTVTVYAAANGCTWAFSTTVNSTLNPVNAIQGFTVSGNGNDIGLGAEVVISGNVIVPAGQTWTVSANTVRFAPNCWIIVQPTGKFYLSNATLDAACPQQWGGIVLEGNPNQLHHPLFQGFALLNKSNIRNARVAVACQGMSNYINVVLPNYLESKKNGLVYASECKFENNTRDVMIRWGNTFEGHVRQDRFKGCHFEVNPEFFPTAAYPRERVFLFRNGGTLFDNCTFLNNDPDRLLTHSMTAIRASQAKTRVLGSTDPALNMSSFIGFTYGIRAILGAGSTNMEVRDTRFACYRGFYSHQISLVHLLRNEFSPLPSNYPVNPPLPGVNAQQDQNLLGHYGAYLNGTLLGLIVEGNRFFNAAQVNEEPRVGLIARNTGFSGDPIIYRNAFEGYPVGCRFLDQNRLISQGMRFSCNEYTNCVFAVDITASPNFFSSNVGIAPFQGSPVMATGNAYNWAGPDALPGFPNQIWRQIGANPNHTYFYHPTETFIPTESNVFNIEGTFSMDENDCSPLNGLLPNNENIIPLYNEIVGLELVRSYLVDAGNTDSLIQLIKSWDVDMNPLFYNYLLNNSPYISVNAMIEMIQRQDPIPASMLTYLLSANSHVLKDDSLITILNEKEFLFSAWMVNLLNESSNNVSDLEQLDAKIGDLRSRIQSLKTAALYYTLATDSTAHTFPYLIDQCASYPELEKLLREASYAGEAMDFAQEAQLCNEIALLPDITSTMKHDLLEYLQLKNDAPASNNILSNGPLTQYWTDIANSPRVTCAAFATHLLDIEDYFVPEPIDYPTTRSASSPRIPEPHNNPAPFEISPNPASTLALVRFHTPETSTSQLLLLDCSGRVVHRMDVKPGTTSVAMDLQPYSPGYYVVVYMPTRFTPHSCPLIIANQ